MSMIQSSTCAEKAVEAHTFLDKVPVLSTITNLIILIILKPIAYCVNSENSHFWRHIKETNGLNCFLLLLPGLGQLIVFVFLAKEKTPIPGPQPQPPITPTPVVDPSPRPTAPPRSFSNPLPGEISSLQAKVSNFTDEEYHREIEKALNSVRAETRFNQAIMIAYLHKRSETDAIACDLLAQCYKQGVGIEKNEAEFFRYLNMTIELGSPRSYFLLAQCHNEGIGTEANSEEALGFFWFAAQRGNVQAKYITGTTLFQLSQEKVLDSSIRKEAIQYIQDAVAAGVAEISPVMLFELSNHCSELADQANEQAQKAGQNKMQLLKEKRHYHNLATEWMHQAFQDGSLGGNDEVIKKLAEAAERKNPAALLQMGLIQIKGLYEFPQNVALGVRMLELAANQKSNLAQFYLGMHKSGFLNGSQTSDTADQIILRNQIADLFNNSYPLVLPSSQRLFVQYIQEAARQGRAEAIAHMGVLHDDGWYGVKKDAVLAYQYFNQAASQGICVALFHLSAWYRERAHSLKDIFGIDTAKKKFEALCLSMAAECMKQFGDFEDVTESEVMLKKVQEIKQLIQVQRIRMAQIYLECSDTPYPLTLQHAKIVARENTEGGRRIIQAIFSELKEIRVAMLHLSDWYNNTVLTWRGDKRAGSSQTRLEDLSLPIATGCMEQFTSLQELFDHATDSALVLKKVKEIKQFTYAQCLKIARFYTESDKNYLLALKYAKIVADAGIVEGTRLAHHLAHALNMEAENKYNNDEAMKRKFKEEKDRLLAMLQQQQRT